MTVSNDDRLVVEITIYPKITQLLAVSMVFVGENPDDGLLNMTNRPREDREHK